MNADRRKKIKEASEGLDAARAVLEEARDEEQDYIDDMPENLQGGDRANRAEEVVDILDTAISELETTVEQLEEATQ